MIGSPVLVQLDLHALLPEGRPDLLPVNTTEQRDELAPFQLTELHSMSASQSRTVGLRIRKDQSVECFCNRSWFAYARRRQPRYAFGTMNARSL